jgi:hypothetical protein
MIDKPGDAALIALADKLDGHEDPMASFELIMDALPRLASLCYLKILDPVCFEFKRISLTGLETAKVAPLLHTILLDATSFSFDESEELLELSNIVISMPSMICYRIRVSA